MKKLSRRGAIAACLAAIGGRATYAKASENETGNLDLSLWIPKCTSIFIEFGSSEDCALEVRYRGESVRILPREIMEALR